MCILLWRFVQRCKGWNEMLAGMHTYVDISSCHSVTLKAVVEILKAPLMCKPNQ